jgi:hypothetical protein
VLVLLEELLTMLDFQEMTLVLVHLPLEKVAVAVGKKVAHQQQVVQVAVLLVLLEVVLLQAQQALKLEQVEQATVMTVVVQG